MSISYGECEAENGSSANAAYNAAYQQAVSEGTSVFVSAGDSGAADCDDKESKATHGIGVNALASTPYNVAMGGTDFSDTYSGTNSSYWSSTNTATYGSALSYIPEIPWNDSCASLLLANHYTGSGTTYGKNGFCNTHSRGIVPDYDRRKWRPQCLCDGLAHAYRNRQRHVPGLAQTLVAVRA